MTQALWRVTSADMKSDRHRNVSLYIVAETAEEARTKAKTYMAKPRGRYQVEPASRLGEAIGPDVFSSHCLEDIIDPPEKQTKPYKIHQ